MRKESDKFFRLFRKRLKWEELIAQSHELKYNPYMRIFKKCYQFLQNPNFKEEYRTSDANFQSRVMNSPTLMLGIAISEEVGILEKRLNILATTVSVSPFLGLLGTVWGVMTAFLNMGIHGSADITFVGPGIAEALITTVAGLAVAIPALVAYNSFVESFNRVQKEMENFFTNLLLKMERER